MNNAELITELTYCANIEKRKLLSDAADALEAADAKIVKLNTKCADQQSQINSMENEIEELLPKEGEWIEDEYGYIHCSRCRMEWDEPEHPQTNFCPNCGAKMRKGDK